METEHARGHLVQLRSVPMRSRVDIMASIMNEMRLCSEGLRKTRLMYRCNLSFGQLKVYLKLLYDKKFMTIVEANDGKMKVEVYRITQEGLAFLKSYNELRSHLAEERLTR